MKNGLLNDPSAQIIALERAALDRWGKGEPDGYLDLSAPEVTYFDPVRETRVNSWDELKAYYAPITGKVKVTRFDMLEPKVQYSSDIAVLSFQLISYGEKPGGPERPLARWNSTEVYRRIEGAWKIIHTHWSYIKPDLKTAPLE